MGTWINIGEALTEGAYFYPDKIAAKDSNRSMTYQELNMRSVRLANALLGSGLKKGDKFAVIALNCVEWMEIYGAAAKAGLVVVPIMFRLAPGEYGYIVEDSEAKAFILGKEFLEGVSSVRDTLGNVSSANYILLGSDKVPEGYQDYEAFLENGSSDEPEVDVDNEDIWLLSYTSGTTGKPKGTLRSQQSYINLFLVLTASMKFDKSDTGLMVMPMCHFNSIFFSFTFIYSYGSVVVYDRMSFDAEDFLRIIAKEKITFTSLIPTHYTLILDLSDEIKKKYDVSCIRRLMCSSAPARRETKKGIMEYFQNSSLYEGYGSTEGGMGTLLHPEDQLRKLAAIGRETLGMARIKLLDEDGKEVPVGEVGELYTKGPTVFSGYWKMPEETKKAFRGEYFSAGDVGRKDEDGFYYLVDRKKNMIITGGENVYPSEVENVIASRSDVKDVAVIGVPDLKWGEAIKAIIILKDGVHESEDLKEDIVNYCKGKIAGFKKPKSVDFIREEEMPRTATGKILHRVLRDRCGKWSEEE